MANLDISNLTVAELEALKGSIDNAIVTRRETELVGLRQKMDDMAAKAGFSLEEIMQARASKKRVIEPKYRNPNNPEQTWSGRGRKPGWVEELVSSGGNLEDHLI